MDDRRNCRHVQMLGHETCSTATSIPLALSAGVGSGAGMAELVLRLPENIICAL